MVDVGRIRNISPRSAWEHEARNFTPWLFDNLQQLGDAVGIEMEPEDTEVSVGPFSADILARDPVGRLVLIENQLEKTDHTHLGQLLTYLSGLEAEIVIWIATDFRDPHLSAINWLNEHTGDRFAFFAVQLKVVAIGDSPVAPIFDVLARPNRWDRKMQQVVRESTGESSKFAPIRKEFWAYYLEKYPEDRNLGVQITGAPSNWLSPQHAIGVFVSIYKSKTGVGVFLRGARGDSPAALQQRLAPHSAKFLELVGNCNNIGDDGNHPSIRLTVDMESKENWGVAVDWLHQTAKLFLDAAIAIFDGDDQQ